jgi:FMN phosphatase YigB (HAD superfamily)
MAAIDKNCLQGVFFDLDGTLLQVEMKQFIPAYTRGLAACFDDITEPKHFSDVLLRATLALLRRQDGSQSNESFFLEMVAGSLDIDVELYNLRLQQYCDGGLQQLADLVQPHPLARDVLERCSQAGLRVVLATNPVFPRPVVEARMAWGGLLDYPFELVTTYENSRFCKPHRGYFADILEYMELLPEHCLMIGNDTEHDLAARKAGVATFLVDTWIVDRCDGAFATDYRGELVDLCRFVDELGNVAESLTR